MVVKKEKQKELSPEEKAVEAGKTEAFLEGRGVGYRAGRLDGKEVGMKEGVELGKKEGFQIGKDHGYKDGKEAGFEVGKKEGKREGAQAIYPVAFNKGKVAQLKGLVTSVEIKMADAAGYQDRNKWARECQIPAWWIAVLVENWEPLLGKEPRESEPSL